LVEPGLIALLTNLVKIKLVYDWIGRQVKTYLY